MKIKNFVLGIGIVVVYALMLWQGIETFYPEPKYEDFCDVNIGPRSFPEIAQTNCVFPPNLEAKQNACYKAKGEFRYEYDEKGCIIDGYCDECSIFFNEASDKYSRNIFIISLITGFITFIIGFAILKIEPVGSALIGSGIWAIFYGTVRNWRNFGAGIRFALLFVVLIILIWLAIRLNKTRKERPFGLWARFGRNRK